LPHEAARVWPLPVRWTGWAHPPFLLDKITSLSQALRQRRMNMTNSTLKLVLAQAK
jgi:hypothetical protein